MQFAEWIAVQRKSRGLSQTEAAARADVDQSVWSDWERQKRQPRKETIYKIADALGINRTEALEAAGYATETPDVPARLLASWRKVACAPTEKQRAWLDSVDRSADLISV